MQIIRIRYNVPLGPMMQDLQRVFPNIEVTAATLRERGGILAWREKKRYAYVKEKFNELGVRTHAIVYAAVRDTFVPPLWLQGIVLNPLDALNPVDHYFMGHEVPVPDPPNEEPEEVIQ